MVVCACFTTRRKFQLPPQWHISSCRCVSKGIDTLYYQKHKCTFLNTSSPGFSRPRDVAEDYPGVRQCMESSSAAPRRCSAAPATVNLNMASSRVDSPGGRCCMSCCCCCCGNYAGVVDESVSPSHSHSDTASRPRRKVRHLVITES